MHLAVIAENVPPRTINAVKYPVPAVVSADIRVTFVLAVAVVVVLLPPLRVQLICGVLGLTQRDLSLQ